MRISARVNYGARLLLDLALHEGNGPVLLKDIAQRQQMPLPYLKHLTTPLITGGLLTSRAGYRGGVSLAKPQAEIRLSEIIRFLEGPIVVECGGQAGSCDSAGSYVSHDILTEAGEAINKALEAITLKDLVDLHIKKGQAISALQEMISI